MGLSYHFIGNTYSAKGTHLYKDDPKVHFSTHYVCNVAYNLHQISLDWKRASHNGIFTL